MGLCKILFSRVIPAFVLVIAVFAGWIARQESPEGVFFATVIPLSQGYLPPTIVGHGRMVGVAEVPDDATLRPRPAQEMFLTLPGGDKRHRHPEKMPMNGLGMCCRPTAYDDEMVYRTVLWYLVSGGRLIDGAHLYLNHGAIGKAVREAVQRGIPRREIFVTTKIQPRNYGRNATTTAVTIFLEELGLDYVDLVLLHFPVEFPLVTSDCTRAGLSPQTCRADTWKSLSEARDTGLVRNVGVSNFNARQIQELRDLRDVAPVAVHQMQYNLWAPDHIVDTFHYCQQHGIAVTAYASLAGLFQHSKALTLDTLNDLATKHDKSVSQIMLRWSLQKGAAVIPGTGNPQHMKENLDVYDFVLSTQDMGNLEALRHDEIAKSFFYMPPDES